MVVLVVAYVLFFYNRPEPPTYQGDVSLSISAPEEIPSGTEISYQISITNNSNVRLLSVNLEAFYPRGFTFLDAVPDPSPDNSRLFALSDLAEGETRKVIIIGQLEGAVQEIKTLTAKLHYQPENFRSNFSAEKAVNTLILSPRIILELIVPSHVVNGQKMTYGLRLTSVASVSFSDLVLRLQFSKSFIPDSAGAPTSTTSEMAEWRIPRLDPEKITDISLPGRVSGEAGEELFAEAQLLLSDESENLLSAGKAYGFTAIRPAPLSLDLILETEESDLKSGKTVQYRLVYENISDIPLQNATVSVIFETPEILDVSGAESEFGQIVGNTMVFAPARYKPFLNIFPQARGELKFKIPISESIITRLIKNPHIAIRTEFAAQQIPESLVGAIIDTRLATVAGIESSIVKISPGLFQVNLTVTNSVNDLADTVLTGILPIYGVRIDQATINPAEERGQFSFNRATGQVRWALGKVFAFSGQFHEARKISFVLDFSESREPVSGEVVLQNLELSGTDEFTGKNLTAKGADLTFR